MEDRGSLRSEGERENEYFVESTMTEKPKKDVTRMRETDVEG